MMKIQMVGSEKSASKESNCRMTNLPITSQDERGEFPSLEVDDIMEGRAKNGKKRRSIKKLPMHSESRSLLAEEPGIGKEQIKSTTDETVGTGIQSRLDQ